MTRSEAIKILWQYDVNFEPHPAEDVMHAIDMAIKALEQEQERQEDIYECQYCFGEVHKNYIYCPFCGMRIEVVEKEETLQNLTKPNKSDLISRQAAIDALYDKGLSMTAWGELLAMKWSDIQTCIELLPSAQPFTEDQIQTMQELEAAQVEKAYELGKADRPKGEWIKTEHCLTDNGYRKWIELECPFCGFRPVFELIDDMNFCPNCGADMRGGDTK